MWKLFEPDVSDAVGEQSCSDCDRQQTDDAGKVPAGTYHLQILASRPWTFTVQQRS